MFVLLLAIELAIELPIVLPIVFPVGGLGKATYPQAS